MLSAGLDGNGMGFQSSGDQLVSVATSGELLRAGPGEPGVVQVARLGERVHDTLDSTGVDTAALQALGQTPP